MEKEKGWLAGPLGSGTQPGRPKENQSVSQSRVISSSSSMVSISNDDLLASNEKPETASLYPNREKNFATV